MNEITKIHLGRQPFVISVDAHKMLQDYLHDIKRQVGAKSDDVLEEVELRMAELLTERGIHDDKVVIADDVTFLKEQLGSPSDFKDDEETGEDTASAKSADDSTEPVKRLFRDTQQGMLAGVSAGLGAYFGIDPIIFRIFFVITTVAAGWGALVYIILWVIMPEAKTASERLQMRGKAVTVDSLKELVDRADVSGAAERAGNSLAKMAGAAAKVVLAVVGVALTTVAVVLLAALGTLGVYMLTHGGHAVHGALDFPIGTLEAVAVMGGVAVMTAVVALLLATGVAMVRRKWIVPGWATAALLALLFAGLVTAGATVPDTVPRVHDRYEANHHVVTRTLPAFEKVEVLGNAANIPVAYKSGAMADVVSGVGEQNAAVYKVTFDYVGDLHVSDIKTTVKDRVLTVDARNFKPGSDWDCDGLCIGQRDYFKAQVVSPEPIGIN